MDCLCSVLAVKSELDALGLKYNYVEVGKVDLIDELTPEMHDKLNARLLTWNLALIEDKEEIFVLDVCIVIKKMMNDNDEKPVITYSKYIENEMHIIYRTIAKRFLKSGGITIQRYIIKLKVKKAIEMIENGSYTSEDIAYKLHYHDISHFSNQLFKETKHRPGYFIIRKLVGV